MSHKVARRERKSSSYLSLESHFHAEDRVMIWPVCTDWLIFLQTCKSIWLVCLIVTTKGMLRIFLTSFILVNFASLHQGRKLFVNENCKRWLLTTSWLFVATLRLALSFAKKNWKKNVSDQGFTHQKFTRNSYWEMFIVSLEIIFLNTEMPASVIAFHFWRV